MPTKFSKKAEDPKKGMTTEELQSFLNSVRLIDEGVNHHIKAQVGWWGQLQSVMTNAPVEIETEGGVDG